MAFERRRRRRFAVGAVALLLDLIALDVRADCDPRPAISTCLSSDALWAMPGGARFAYLAGTELPAPGRFGVALISTYQSRPVVLHVATPGPEGTTTSAVDGQLGATLVTTYGLHPRVAGYLALPGTLYQSGGGNGALTGRPAPDAASLRDPRLGAAIALLRREGNGPLAITAYADAQLPTRATNDFGGEKGITLAPTLAADLRVLRRLLLATSLGARVRTAPQTFVGERQGTQALAGLGASVDLLPRDLLALAIEGRVIAGFAARDEVRQDAFGVQSRTPRTIFGGEWLASARTSVLHRDVVMLAGAGGTLPLDGLVGIPEWRGVLGFAYTPTTAPVPAPSPVVAPAPWVEEPPPPPPPPPPVSVRREPPPPPPVRTEPPTGACAATCTADATSALPAADEGKLASALQPFLEELRACLGRVGAERVRPAILVRFTEAGALLSTRLDLGGHEDLSCAKEAASRVPALSASRGTTVRCELRCR